MQLISIVPRLPPVVDGVGDYAFQLACQLRQNNNIHTCFVVCDPSWIGPSYIDGFPVYKLSERSSDVLLNVLTYRAQGISIALLQFSGYGYARWGCPWWLINGLALWKKQAETKQLITMFHELYNKPGPPWKHNFWTSPIQKYLAVRLAQISDHCLTNKQEYAENLVSFNGNKHVQISIMPVFSNIGEPSIVTPLDVRKKRLIIFGQQGTRLAAYKWSLSILNQACQKLQIQEIWDIGPSIDLPTRLIGECPIIEIGRLSAEEISDILLDSIAGFVHYNPDALAKSGIFAAYCAHGLLPIVHPWSSQAQDGLEVDYHYWNPEYSHQSACSPEDLQTIASNAFAWYQKHALVKQADIFANLVFA